MNAKDRVRVTVMGVVHSRLQQGLFMLVLAQEGHSLRVPVIIGTSEAQSIAVTMEKLTPPRPLAHDVVTHICEAFGLQLVEVSIDLLEKGVFYTTMLLSDGVREVVVDARVSDAVAVALRMNAPIYMSRDVLTRAGYDASEVFVDKNEAVGEDNLDVLSDADLAERIKTAVASENYEEAALIQQILQKRKV